MEMALNTTSDIARLRVDLAAALRWAARLELHEGVDNHFSMAVAGDDGVRAATVF